jgi:hypothetical protein
LAIIVGASYDSQIYCYLKKVICTEFQEMILQSILYTLIKGFFAFGLCDSEERKVVNDVYPIVPAPVIFLALGIILLGSHLLPRVLGYLAFGLGIAFAVVGFICLFTSSLLTIVVLSLQALWVLAAAITFLVRSGNVSDSTENVSLSSNS